MAKTKLKDAKDYIALTLQGVSKKDAAQKVLGTTDSKAIRTMENSDAFKLLRTTMENNHQLQLTRELQTLQAKTLKAQAELLDQGSALLEQAETLDDKLKAQENQRRNLETTVIERAASWNGPDRNHDANEASILEGVILP
jgi:hypothetical protein